MKVLHLADLHLGKRVNAFNMIEDQIFALNNILDLVEKEGVDLVLIAGDIYDQKLPSNEALGLFDDFLTGLTRRNIKCMIIPGNHDSEDRLTFASQLLRESGIYLARQGERFYEKLTLEDEYGFINFYLLPFLKPIDLKGKLGGNKGIEGMKDIEIDDFQKALSYVVETIDLDKNQRNVLMVHQFIVGAERSDSEEIYLGGLEAVPLDTFDDFDYVAMGHIHKRQSFRDGMVSYPGSLLKYSKSEANYKKLIRIVDFHSKGEIEIKELEIKYLRDMRIIEGYLEDLLRNGLIDEAKDDYIHAVLYDEDEQVDAIGRLRKIYPNIMTLVYQDQGKDGLNIEDIELKEKKDPLKLFEEFYEIRNNKKLDEGKKTLISSYVKKIWGVYED